MLRDMWWLHNDLYISPCEGDRLLEHLLLRKKKKNTELCAWGFLKNHHQIISGMQLHTMTKQRKSAPW